MIKVKHRFLSNIIPPETETLIIGTFNPDTPDNDAEFFYGRSRNYLWRLLPTAFGEPDLKQATKEEKVAFINRHKINLIDLIEEIEVDEGEEANYYDGYIDGRVTEWRDINGIIDNLPNLKRVCFTRKTFSDIPNMKARLEAIEKHCFNKSIPFKALTTPARFYRDDKQEEWSNFLLNDNR